MVEDRHDTSSWKDMWVCRKNLNVKFGRLFNLAINNNVIMVDMLSSRVGGGS